MTVVVPYYYVVLGFHLYLNLNVQNNQILTLLISQVIDAVNRWIDSILKSEKIKRLNRVNTIKVQGFLSLYSYTWATG